MAASEVAQHYNAVKQVGVDAREKSRIYYQRNLNNWIKSQLIDEAVQHVKEDAGGYYKELRILDLASGKGGDIMKWQIAHASSVVMADIADVSIEQAKERYRENYHRSRNRYFKAQFIVADCCKVDLPELVERDKAPFDIVSCQFALHYSFINEESARQFLKNATSMLKPGGYFIGTLPDAHRIVWAARQNNGEFKNPVCSVKFENKDELDGQPPLFGAMFHFNLDSQVNCPEFLCFFPLLQKLLEEMDMELVLMERFPDAINSWLTKGKALLGRMKALESYPPEKDTQLIADEEEYNVAAEFVKKLDSSTPSTQVGTISRSEWEAVCMYLCFIFRKKITASVVEAKAPPTIHEVPERRENRSAPEASEATKVKKAEEDEEAAKVPAEQGEADDQEPPAKVARVELEPTEDTVKAEPQVSDVSTAAQAGDTHEAEKENGAEDGAEPVLETKESEVAEPEQ